MLNEDKSLLERQSDVEKKIGQIEEQLELFSEALEAIVEQMQNMNKFFIDLSKP